MSNIKTVYRSYSYDTSKPNDAKAYADLKAKLKGQGRKVFKTHGGNSHYQPAMHGRELELETKHLFDNQWNTACGKRVFDWAEDAIFSPYNGRENLKDRRGHYLELTPEMSEVRRNTCACGYCGKQEPAAKGYVFCPHCLSSEYLDEKTLHLLRMLPVDESGINGGKRAELTEAERAHLMPLFIDAQLHGTARRNKAKAEKERATALRRYEEAIEAATKRRDGEIWLLDHGLSTDNVIYYDHTGRFSFGWRKPLKGAELEAWAKALEGFPGDFDIETKDRRG